MGDDFEVIGRFDGEDDLTPKLDNIAAGFQRVTDAATYLAEITGQMGGGLEGAVSAWTALDEAARLAAQAVDGFAKQSLTSADALGQLNNQTSTLAKEMQTAWFEIDNGVAQMDAMSAAAAGMDGRMSGLITSMGVYDDALANAVGGTRTLADGTIVAGESLQTAGGAALLAASQTRTYDESLRGVDVTLQQTASEQRAAAEALAQFQAELAQGSNALTTMTEKEQADAEAAYLLAEKLGLVADGSTQINTALRFSLVELESLTNAFKSSAVSVQDFVAAGYNIKDVNAGLQVLIETGDASAAAMKVLTSQMGQFSSVAVPALLDVHNTFNILGQDITKASVETNELIAKNAELAGSYVGLTKAEQEQQIAMLTGLQIQNEARQGVVEIGDALSMTVAEQLALGEATLKSLTTMYAQGLAAGEDADKLAALRMQITETAAQMDTLAASERTAADAGGGEGGGFGMSSFLLLTLGMMALGAGRQFLAMGIDVEHGLNVIQLATNSTDEQMQTWKSTLESLGNTWGVQMPQMVASLDLVTRAQFRATDATDVLNAAAQFANHTNNEMVGSTDLLTTSLKAYGAGADQASTFAGVLETTWDNSRLSLGELSSLMGNSLPIAAGLGISFSDLGTAVGVFSQATASGMIATRDFQAMLAGLQTFANSTDAQLQKLAGSFDLTKFATMDFTAKLAALAAASGGSEATFTKLIGGANNAKIAMDNLNISDKQLEINAANLGVAFNKTTFDSLDAAGKLLYLMTIVDDSGPKFAKLTDGTKATNTALAGLSDALDKGGQKAFDMSKQFDMAVFKSDDLSQKLWDLADFLGKTSPAFLTAIGGAKNLQEALRIMGLEADQHHETHVDTTQSQQHIHDASTAMDNLHRKIDEVHHIPVIPPVSTKPIDDVTLALNRMKTAVSQAAVSLETTLAPALVIGLNGMASALNFFSSGTWNDLWNHLGMEMQINFTIAGRKLDDYIRGGFKGSTVAAMVDALKGIGPAIQQAGTDMQVQFTIAGQKLDDYIRGGFKGSTIAAFNDWRQGIDQVFRQIVTDAVTFVNDLRSRIDEGFRQMVTGTLATIGTWVSGVIQLFQRLFQTLVGGSIVPEMVAAILRSFTTGATEWLVPITSFVTNAQSTFNNALATLTAIAQSIGANVNSAFVTAGAVWNSTVGAAMSTVVATVQSWVGAATSAGAAVGNAIGNGLQSAVGWVTQAANNVAGAIAGIFQHLSPPKEGPLHTDDQWMPNMVKMMASGITDNTGTLRQAAITAATSITMPLQSVSQTQFVQSTGNTATDMTPVVQILAQIYQVLRTQQMQGPATGGQSSIRGNVSQQQMLATLYQMLNGYGGFTFESGSRGAYAGLGV